MADRLNAATKYVATQRPESLKWGPFEGIGPDLVKSVRDIKAKDGADLTVSGSSTLTSALLELADDLVLLVDPVLLGKEGAFLRRGHRHARLLCRARKLCRRASSSTSSRPLEPLQNLK